MLDFDLVFGKFKMGKITNDCRANHCIYAYYNNYFIIYRARLRHVFAERGWEVLINKSSDPLWKKDSELINYDDDWYVPPKRMNYSYKWLQWSQA